MSKSVTVYGASDDLIEWDGCEGCDEFTGEKGLFQLAAGVDSILVEVRYTKLGCWFVAIMPHESDGDGGGPMPDWPISMARTIAPDYSAQLTFTVPDDARLAVVTLK